MKQPLLNIALRRSLLTRQHIRYVGNCATTRNDIFTVPNVISMTRIACSPMVGYCLYAGHLGPALGLFGYSCLTDMLDGYIARKYSMGSAAGAILDPLGDKLLMTATTIALAVPSGPQVVPFAIAGLILGRDFLLGTSALYLRYKSLRARLGSQAKINWSNYFNIFGIPSVQVVPTLISKWNTFLQMIYLGSGVVLLYVSDENENKVTEYSWYRYFGYLVGTTTLFSGASYLTSKTAVTFILK